MKVLITGRHYALCGLGISHYGARVKRKLGGPRWYRYVNGIYIATKTKIVWIMFRHPDWTEPGKFITDRRRSRNA